MTPALLDEAQAIDWGLHDRMVDALGNEIISDLYRVNSLRIRLIRLDRVMLDEQALGAGDGGTSCVDRGVAHARSRSRRRGDRRPLDARAQPRARTLTQPGSNDRMDTSAAIRGLWCATLTPLDARRRHRSRAVASHIRDLFAQGVDGVAPFGTTGEGPSFSVDERRRASKRCSRPAFRRRAIVAGTGCAALPDAVALTRHARARGRAALPGVAAVFLQGVVATTRCSRYYAKLIDAVADSRLRVYLYHIPQISGGAGDARRRCAAGRRVIRRSSPASRTAAATGRTRRRCSNAAPQLSILVGHEPHLPRLLRAGGAGTICGVANVFPRCRCGAARAEGRRRRTRRGSRRSSTCCSAIRSCRRSRRSLPNRPGRRLATGARRRGSPLTEPQRIALLATRLARGRASPALPAA